MSQLLRRLWPSQSGHVVSLLLQTQQEAQGEFLLLERHKPAAERRCFPLILPRPPPPPRTPLQRTGVLPLRRVLQEDLFTGIAVCLLPRRRHSSGWQFSFVARLGGLDGSHTGLEGVAVGPGVAGCHGDSCPTTAFSSCGVFGSAGVTTARARA